ncbi:MAG: AAA family ATPase [Gemmataceae bacterium]
MFTNLELRNFKNFRSASVPLGPFTVIVGANASGKSNLRDGFRFMHGISRLYSFAEIIGEKYGEGGDRQWSGIRGGTKELAFSGESVFGLGVSMAIRLKPQLDPEVVRFSLDIGLGGKGTTPPCVIDEQLVAGAATVYQSLPRTDQPDGVRRHLFVSVRPDSDQPLPSRPLKQFRNDHAVLVQLTPGREVSEPDGRMVIDIRHHLESIKFLDLIPERMRQPSFPGQIVLGDHGDNLSSVLQAICEDDRRKAALLEWVRELTPMDAVGFEFPPDQIGRILLTLIEADGRRTTAYSASDGTLRFLAMAAALLGPEPARMYFIEELDNGIHPTRLHLLLQLIERTVRDSKTQVIATTHSPDLLGLLSEQALRSALLVYRLPHQPEARVKRILELPDAERLIKSQSASRLHASGWLEDAVAFTEGGE